MLVMQSVTYNIFGKGKLYVGQGVECSDPDWETTVHQGTSDPHNS